MREHPILFSAPMVRALLDGSKTQTRRVMSRQKQHAFTDYTVFGQRGHPADEAARRGGWGQPWVAVEHAPDWPDGKEDRCHCPYARERGDRLWVRETHRVRVPDQDGKELDYRADYPGFRTRDDDPCGVAWVPSIHMRRAYSRIDLEVARVRVERLQDISQADARAEGMPEDVANSPRVWYSGLWQEINGAGTWAANPWVWVVEFRRLRP